MVDVDVEMDGVGEVVGGGQGAEAAGEGVEAVEGEDFDDESEVRFFLGGASSEGRVRVPVSGEGDRGRVEVGVEEEPESGKDEEQEERQGTPLGGHRHCSSSYGLQTFRENRPWRLPEIYPETQRRRQWQSEAVLLDGGTPLFALWRCIDRVYHT